MPYVIMEKRTVLAVWIVEVVVAEWVGVELGHTVEMARVTMENPVQPVRKIVVPVLPPHRHPLLELLLPMAHSTHEDELFLVLIPVVPQ
jgi:hypothetical protein